MPSALSDSAPCHVCRPRARHICPRCRASHTHTHTHATSARHGRRANDKRRYHVYCFLHLALFDRRARISAASQVLACALHRCAHQRVATEQQWRNEVQTRIKLASVMSAAHAAPPPPAAQLPSPAAAAACPSLQCPQRMNGPLPGWISLHT